MRNLNIIFGSCQAVSLYGDAGGIRNEIVSKLNSIQAIGHNVQLFNQWEKYNFKNIDIFHIFAADFRTYILAKEMRNIKNIKLVISPIIDKTLSNFTIRLLNKSTSMIPKLYTNLGVSQEMCQIADLVIVRSDEEYERVTEAFNIAPSKVKIVPNYVDEKFKYGKGDLFIKEYGIKDFLLTVGQIGNPRKNHLRLIQAAGALGVQLVIIGTILNNSYAKKCIEEARRFPNIKVFDYVDEHILLSAYAACNTFILPSTMEGTGLAGLEAGLAGANVIMTMNGGTKYHFGNCVEYVNPFSVDSIKHVIKLNFGKPKSELLKNHILNHFTVDKIGKLLEGNYFSLLR
ncbi:glycosyltransferase family 4 protein [Paenibacillus radicis (ex Xue et al. 2023)]|uniref:Glycosyltransferase family 4 protein n=1 Tax=Paenibacillus radicis (ex Xue et al. 2023) TaxID=2972489 RepID=A0ABT1YGT8_9BACL|nr:glycosyltransferase family 4 protein [Paenibacillus radicis (ex Xue et al. 2023)]MCR8632410.1 glycosyltransferase family 4 protein [Paenibacillus radicis (ex Xue et al. 2023)]